MLTTSIMSIVNDGGSSNTSDISEDIREQDTRFLFQWQKTKFVDGYIVDSRWPSTDMPDVLQRIPDNVIVSPQLQNILRWSTQQVSPSQITEPDSPERSAEEKTAPQNADPDPSPAIFPPQADLKTHVADQDASSSHASEKEKKPASTLFSRLKQLRQEVATKMELKGQSKEEMKGTASPPAAVVSECISCFDEFQKTELVSLTCSHDYCKMCLREVVLNAMKNESAFPPKCCLTEVPLKTALICLDVKQRNEYKEKTEEYAIPAGHRWYCPDPKCSKWIKPEKLHKVRRSQQTCPHCSIKICSICRSPAHDSGQTCPQDFGVQSILDIAEAEGWRRCYSCRTMVELTTGCRHITCKCGAQFCYVCNAKWRTCSCTETDKTNRINQLREQREGRARAQLETERQQAEQDAAAQAEAEEIAEAIRQIAEMEREDALRRAHEERIRQLEEELLLAQLEEARLLEEIAKKEAEEAAELQLRETLIESSREESQALMRTLMMMINFQHASLMSDHAALEEALTQQKDNERLKLEEDSHKMSVWLEDDINRRKARLDDKQREEWEQLLLQAEEEEDEMFMQMKTYFRDKRNSEQRQRRMQEGFQKQQEEKQEILQSKHGRELQTFEVGVKFQREGLQKAALLRLSPLETQYEPQRRDLGSRIGCERRWFQLISHRRIEMMKMHRELLVSQIQNKQDADGLSEERALDINRSLPAESNNDVSGQNEMRLPGAFESISEDRNVTPTCEQVGSDFACEITNPYGSTSIFPEDKLAPVSSNRFYSHTSQDAMHDYRLHQSALSRSDTIRHVPGAFPVSGSNRSRHQHLQTRARGTEPDSAKNTPNGSLNDAMLIPGRIAISPLLNATSDPTIAQDTARYPHSGSVSPSSLSSKSTNDLQPTDTTTLTPDSSLEPASPSSYFVNPAASYRFSTATSRSRSSMTEAETDLLDTISASKVATPRKDWSRSSISTTSSGGKARRSIFGALKPNRGKELSEEEIKRRMSRCVGDGYGI